MLAKKRLARLRRMVAQAEKHEARMQAGYGGVCARSRRASDLLDLATLKAALAELEKAAS